MGDQGWTVNEWAGWLDGCSSVDTHRGPDAMPTVTQHLVVCGGGRGGGGGAGTYCLLEAPNRLLSNQDGCPGGKQPQCVSY
ncbi:hypothetical protein MGG_17380 [Pyricularia oryzae 70-15]|uniref:Uncharacterized protein n=1 Tax=Pyricularia oryzae (strain 70-15 / ATCC MYA-4617 / FGSC 8958) TaxID=242507 RepID=G4NEP9_PYRO7|nr:uncharacterized protein MGG_17380 [Pyricularia oryzae 70-15]EHA48679.1 hypothetical protein MGG_17380 [Pyricularia oryzae 70-15]